MKLQEPNQVAPFDFYKSADVSLLVCCGGFEERSLAFIQRLKRRQCNFEAVVLLRYKSQSADNDRNFRELKRRIAQLYRGTPIVVETHSDRPQHSFEIVKAAIKEATFKTSGMNAIVDISAMTHLLALASLDGCFAMGLNTKVVYTEAKKYFPLKTEAEKLLEAWRNHNYRNAENYLQSAALKSVDIMPEFQGNSRPGRPLCLVVFAGLEPNRLEGLVSAYAPSALIVVYGKSPHKELFWRTELSRKLHQDIFRGWLIRETETSTIDVNQVLNTLESEFQVIREKYDIAITPHYSKMQGVAAYLFWRRHPEIQIVFTTPIRFNPKRYSNGEGLTFQYEIDYRTG